MPCKDRVGGDDAVRDVAVGTNKLFAVGATANVLPSCTICLPVARLHSRIATNCAAHPSARRLLPVVHLMRATVSSMQESTPSAFDCAAKSFCSFSHLATLPTFPKHAFHSFCNADTDAIGCTKQGGGLKCSRLSSVHRYSWTHRIHHDSNHCPLTKNSNIYIGPKMSRVGSILNR